MKKREMIGIVFLVVAIFLLVLNLAINIYLENLENEKLEEKPSTKKMAINLELTGENYYNEES